MYGLVILLSFLAPNHDSGLYYECDLMVLNHLRGEDGNVYMSQLIFFEVDYKKGIYAARQYKVLNKEDELNSLRIIREQDAVGVNWYYYWHANDGVFIRSRHFLTIHSEEDLEVENRGFYPNHYAHRDFGITPKAKDYWKNNYKGWWKRFK